MADTESRLADLQKDLRTHIHDPRRPVTALLAGSVSGRLSKLQNVLIKEFEAIRSYRGLS